MKRISFCLIATFCILFAQQNGARYLIITHDSYYDVLKPLAEWKTQKGLRAKIVKLSETGSDSSQIRAFVVNAYNNWDVKPEYLLLVGNRYQLPFPRMGNTPYDWIYSDNYYANTAGDFHNELIPARLWVFDTVQAKTIVAKILGYEKTPYMQDPSWFKKAVTIVNEDDYPPYSDSVYWADARYAHQLMNSAGFVHIDSLAESLGDSSADVMDAINNGRLYILYRGVGVQYWDYPFSGIEPSEMSNGFKLPIVISATCATVEGIGYEWLNAGTPEQPKGTVGFFGTTTILDHAAEIRSAVAKGTIQGIFCDSFTTLGKAAEAGRLYYYDLFGNTLEYNGWTCLGDPEMTVWTGTPRQVDVAHAPRAWLGDTLTVTVKYNGLPVESTLVCVMALYDRSVYHYNYTDNNGEVRFVDQLCYPDSAILTVTGRNILPHVDTILGGFIGGPCVAYASYLILDTLGGNGNYQANNGEDIELGVWLLNVGDSVAHDVSAVLQKAETDNYFQLADTVKFFGDIAPLDSVFSTPDGYNVIIDPDCPDSHLVRLNLVMTDNYSNTWTSGFSFLVYSPRPYLVYLSHAILDTTGGNGDYQVNPAEIVEVPVWVKNIGDSLAQGVNGIIQKDTVDPYFYLNDTLKNLGTILPYDSSWTGADGYNVLVDSSCPDQHAIRLKLKITDALDSTWIYKFSLVNYAPKLVLDSYYINDSLKYITGGDTATMFMSLQNTGSVRADSVTAQLISNDSLVTVISGNAVFGNILPGEIGNNNPTPFLITASPSFPIGDSAILKAAITAGVYQDTVILVVYLGQRDYLVWDPDPNHSSGFVIHMRLTTLGYLGDYKQLFPVHNLNIYKSLFITVGMYPNKYVLYYTDSNLFEIVQFILAGGRAYLEGGDVWYFDPQNGGYDFSPLFYIAPMSNNIGNFAGLVGYGGTFTNQMNFSYSGENSSIDRINPTGSSIAIFKNAYNSFNCGVAANHRTIGLSVEFGGLVDGPPPSTKLALIDSIMDYFGLLPQQGLVETNKREIGNGVLEIYPNPFNEKIKINFEIPQLEMHSFLTGKSEMSLKIYDASGRLVKSFCLPSAYSLLPSTITWDGTDEIGRKVPAGVYFVQLKANSVNEIRKIILLR